LAVQLPYRGTGGPLHLLIDSTGIKVRGEGEWHARKHGGAKRRVWRKVHLAIDEATMEVRAVEITDSSIGDAPMLPGLLSQIPEGEPIASVTADGAYDGRACRGAIAMRGAEAVIPPREGCQALEEGQPRRPGPQRRPACHEALRADALAQVVRGQPATGSRAAPNAITDAAGSRPR
jgi:hypothetical protein